ncbi:rve domain-containing protein/RVT_3 domain-containing protein [Gossypium australe]|uniref:Rve domain-containing protein/RVT_3 domain-containing protein n=1 Tax=Gossypium australe TaxID=47621 RepID=A0A5B6V989_9ROSI|nr:rve domain-containing protein/RVT_3 domain-containing protein [Gossypium australe]
MYYVNKVLQHGELKYTNIEKCIYSLIIAACKLCPYFQAHPISMVTNQPMKEADTLGRITKWNIELVEFRMDFTLGTTIKGQMLVDFLVECSFERNEDTSVSAPARRQKLDHPHRFPARGKANT